jgi:hypothetical protein
VTAEGQSEERRARVVAMDMDVERDVEMALERD